MNQLKAKPAVAYTRVSTKAQGDHGIGLDGQRAAINAYADSDGYEILDYLSDTASGAGERNLERRPGLQQAISIAKARGIPIIVAGLDRLSRDTRTTEQIILEENIVVISATEGRMENPVIIKSRAARAQHDRDMISLRTKQALAEKKRQGVKLGNPNIYEVQKIGATRNKERAEDKAKEIAGALEEVDGWSTLTAADVVDLLNARSILTGRGKPWTLSAIRRPLANAKRQLEARKEERRIEEAKKAYGGNPNFGRF